MPKATTGSGVYFLDHELPTPDQAVALVKKAIQSGERLRPGKVDVIFPDGTELGITPLIRILTGIGPVNANGNGAYHPRQAIDKLYDAGYTLINFGSESVKYCRTEIKEKLAQIGMAVSRVGERPVRRRVQEIATRTRRRSARAKPAQVRAESVVEAEAGKSGIFSAAEQSTDRDYETFFSRLEPILSSQITLFSPQIKIRNNTLQIHLPHPKGCHYEVRLGRDYYEIGLHFESSPKRNEARRQAFEPHLEQLTDSLSYSVKAERWGQNWSRVWIQLPVEVLTSALAESYAALAGQFITETYSLLQSAVIVSERSPQRRPAVRRIPRPLANDAQHLVLDHEIEAIRAFLDGRTEQHPSSEKLCDWVQFCYAVGLFNEAERLFSLVSPGEVNTWYFERTRKLAQICALKARTE